MLKKINWKAVLFVFTWLVCLAGLGVLMSFIDSKKSELKCSDVKVIIPGTSSFIDRKEVNRILDKHAGPLVGRFLYEINIHRIEKVLKENPYIRKARVYADMDGVVHIEIEQREPLLRVINYTNQNFYIDNDGFKIPASASYTPHVLVVNGFVMEHFSGRTDTLKTEMAKDLYRAALYIQSDSLWKEQIEQMYVNEQKEIELVPRVGNHKILLGNADSLDIRLRNLLIFYKKAIPSVGWDAYKTINIKYANQIICEKNMIDSNHNTAPVAEISPVDSLENITNNKKIKP
ncbi:cell division protein FtsQ/DivIB [Pararcticibacter amylolyticus]|uniref:cell division protein FtsQ/DivIB n=1 Tax=Pararcticibacter amylolyticus TaxID=2173175 RepID=UPI00192E32C9|nr:cell division protein FtsQ [Pararcticibacter amylolyticus]